MQHSEAKAGRVFVIRLEDGEILHEALEAFAKKHQIRAASLIAVGGIDKGSVLIVGPEQGRASPIVPLKETLEEVHEVTGTGTIFPDDTGEPMLHMHLACGRKGHTVVGCGRHGVRVWHVLEVVLTELTGTNASRRLEPASGFKLLQP